MICLKSCSDSLFVLLRKMGGTFFWSTKVTKKVHVELFKEFDQHRQRDKTGTTPDGVETLE